MFKKRIKILTAMVAIVLIVAAVTSTNAKYVGEKSMVFDMNIEVSDGPDLHGELREVIDGKAIFENLIYDTNCVSVSSYYKNYNNWILKITTEANSDYGNGVKACIDPYVNLDLYTAFTAMGGYTLNEKTYTTLDTDIIRYMVISYYVPATEIPDRAPYNTVDYSVNDYNHMRVYTSTSENVDSNSYIYGSLRFVKLPDAFNATQAAEGTGGEWVTEIIDLQAVNMRGVSMNGTGSANGLANWDGSVGRLRLDIGQIGGSEAWFNATTKHDAPEGKSVYITHMMFFNSYYRAARAKINLAYELRNVDPLTYNFSNPSEFESGEMFPAGTLKEQEEYYVYVDAINATEDTVTDTFD